MLQDPRIRYLNLHDNLKARVVPDYDPELAALRIAADYFTFGSAGGKIVYGAVNLGGPGLVSYGSVCMLIRNKDIQLGTSFLEGNTFSYLTGTPPNAVLDLSRALRAVWDTLLILAVVKHLGEICSPGAAKTTLADILLKSSGDKRTDRFIEAQVYPDITVRNVERVTYSPAHSRRRGKDPLLNSSLDIGEQLLDLAANKKDLHYQDLGQPGISIPLDVWPPDGKK